HAVYALALNFDGLTELLTVPETTSVLDVSVDGKAAVTEDRATISIIDTSTDAVLHALAIDATATAAHFSPDGKVLAVTLADRIATQLWDVETGALADEVAGFETAAPAYSVQFGPAGRVLIWSARPTAQVM